LIIVVGLAFEARIAAGPEIQVVCGGDGSNLTAALTAAIAEARLLFGDCPATTARNLCYRFCDPLRIESDADE
jgi:hypothetical protein